MLCVIADDFTGAAEIAGVALRYGMAGEVQTELRADVDAPLICVDTDTRSCRAEVAARRVALVARQCRAAGLRSVFKKVDSAVRGNVVAELSALMGAFSLDRALLVPANPTLGRVIIDGQYLVQGTPLHLTDFARDPEYPAKTADVRDILTQTGYEPIHVLPSGAGLAAAGIIVGETASHEDVTAWACRLDRGTLPAGAAEFFGAFLEQIGFERLERASLVGRRATAGRSLFVSGSVSDQSHAFCRRSEVRGIPVLRMPVGLFEQDAQAPRLVREWSDAAVRGFATCAQVIVAIDRPLRHEPGLPHRLSGHLGAVVQHVLAQIALKNVFIEGGATAAALARRLGWKRLIARREMAPGVVSMQVDPDPGPLITLKPGSYGWPDDVWLG